MLSAGEVRFTETWPPTKAVHACTGENTGNNEHKAESTTYLFLFYPKGT